MISGMAEPNPFKAPDPAGLRTTRPGALNPFQHVGVYVLAVLVVFGFMAIRAGFGVFNAWLLQRPTQSQQIERIQEFLESEKRKAEQQREE